SDVCSSDLGALCVSADERESAKSDRRRRDPRVPGRLRLGGDHARRARAGSAAAEARLLRHRRRRLGRAPLPAHPLDEPRALIGIGRRTRPPKPTGAKADGRSGGIRTHDPLTPSQVRYQAALRSVRRGSALIGSGWPRGNRLGERRMRWVAVLGLLLALAATPAAAQPPTAAPSDQVASAAFEKGEAAYKAKDYAAAMSFFRIAAD